MSFSKPPPKCGLFDATIGVSICKMYVINPEDFRFKVEAMNYKPSTTRSEIMPITMETLSGVKTQIQQSLAKANTPRAQHASRGLNTAHVDRNRFISQMDRGFSNKGAVQPFAVKQERSDVESNWASRSNVVQTSNVSFVGPPSDAESRRKRACESQHLCRGCPLEMTCHFQTDICLRRYQKEANVSFLFFFFIYTGANYVLQPALDQLIDDFADLIRAHYDISEFGDPSATTDVSGILSRFFISRLKYLREKLLLSDA